MKNSTIMKPVLRPVMRSCLSGIFSAIAATGGGGPAVQSSILVTTDTDTGTIYWVLTNSATPPSVAAIKAGTGIVAGSIVVTSAGIKTQLFPQPPAGTYYPHFVHTNTGVDSDVHTGTEDTVV